MVKRITLPFTINIQQIFIYGYVCNRLDQILYIQSIARNVDDVN
jgi:hypothetical protein